LALHSPVFGMHFWFRRFAIVAVLQLAWSARSAPINMIPPDPMRPNIIWIIANDLGIGDLGSYGQKQIQTHHLDRMAREGMRFTDFAATSPNNLISRVSMLTGRDPRHLDLLTNSPVFIEPGIPTVAKALQDAGYRTGFVGHWGLGEPNHYSQPQRKGFIDWVGTLEPQEKFIVYPNKLWRTDPFNKLDGEISIPQHPGKYIEGHELFLRGMTNYVRIHLPDPYNKFRPFFLVASFGLPNPVEFAPSHTNDFKAVYSTGRYATRPWSKAEMQKAAAITQLDAYVGRLFAVLEKHRQVTNTVVFLTSDGGPFERNKVDVEFFDSNGPCRGKAGDLTEGGLRVPLLVRWPTMIRPNRTNHLMFTHADLMPTTLALAGAAAPAGMDGISFRPALLGQKQTNRHPWFVWQQTNGVAVREGHWKAIHETNSWSLFNLTNDLAEATNVVARHPDELARLKAHFAQWVRDDDSEIPSGEESEK
jgi:arylsulfatase A-like enzyme